MQNFFEQECKAVCDVKSKIDPCLSLHGRGSKFTWLARHRNGEVLSDNGDIFLLRTGRFIIGTNNI